MGVDVMRDQILKRRDLNTSRTLGCTGTTDGNPNPNGHDTEGDCSPGQTHKKPRDLSVYDREDRGCGEGGGVYVVSVIARTVSMGWVPV